MIREIIRMGHPTLRQLAKPYPEEKIGSEEFLELVEDMRDTLHASGGIGLAAPQIDIPYSLAVIEIINEESRYGDIPLAPFAVYINPTITELDETSAGYWEGCLSIPNIMGYVERPQHIQIDFTNESAQTQSLEVDGFLATVFQHEFDHLQGKLFIDRVNDTEKLAFDAEYRDFHLEQI